MVPEAFQCKPTPTVNQTVPEKDTNRWRREVSVDMLVERW